MGSSGSASSTSANRSTSGSARSDACRRSPLVGGASSTGGDLTQGVRQPPRPARPARPVRPLGRIAPLGDPRCNDGRGVPTAGPSYPGGSRGIHDSGLVGRRGDLLRRPDLLLHPVRATRVGDVPEGIASGRPGLGGIRAHLQLHRAPAGGRATEVVGVVPPAAPDPLPRQPRPARDLDLRAQRHLQELRARRRVHGRTGPPAGDLLVHPVAGQEHLPRSAGSDRCRGLRIGARLSGPGGLPAASGRLSAAGRLRTGTASGTRCRLPARSPAGDRLSAAATPSAAERFRTPSAASHASTVPTRDARGQ